MLGKSEKNRERGSRVKKKNERESERESERARKRKIRSFRFRALK